MEPFGQLAIGLFLALGLIVVILSFVILCIVVSCARVLRRVNKMIKIMETQNAFLAASSRDHGWLSTSPPAAGAA